MKPRLAFRPSGFKTLSFLGATITALLSISSTATPPYTGLNQCMRDLCGTPGSQAPLYRGAWIDNEVNLAESKAPSVNTGFIAPPVDDSALLKSRLGITDWFGDLEIESEKNDPFRTKAHEAAKLLTLTVHRLEGLQNPSLTQDIELLKRIANATRSLHVFRSHDLIAAEAARDFVSRWEKLMQASYEVMIEDFRISPEFAMAALRSYEFKIQQLPECAYDISLMWKTELGKTERISSLSFEYAKEGLQKLTGCTSESTPYTKAKSKQYDEYLAEVVRFSEASKRFGDTNFSLTMHDSIKRLEKMWKPRSSGYGASANASNTIYISRNIIREAYSGDFALAHEIGHLVPRYQNSDASIILKKDIPWLTQKENCLTSRNHNHRRGTWGDENHPAHYTEDRPDHFAALVIRKLYPQRNSPAICNFLDPLKVGETYADEVDLSRSPWFNAPHSRPEVRVLLEAIDNEYLPNSCQKVIEGDRLNRSCR